MQNFGWTNKEYYGIFCAGYLVQLVQKENLPSTGTFSIAEKKEFCLF